MLEGTQNGEAIPLGYVTALKSCAFIDSFVCFSKNKEWFKRLDLSDVFCELLMLYLVTDFAYMLTMQGNEDLGLLEMDCEVFPAVLPSKVTEVEGCIRMYEEMHRLKGKVEKTKPKHNNHQIKKKFKRKEKHTQNVEGICESQESYITRCNNALVEVSGQ